MTIDRDEWEWPEAGQNAVIRAALRILETRARYATGAMIDGNSDAEKYLRLALGGEEREIFGVMFLDASGQMIQFERMFMGSITSAAVYPREIVKAAMRLNAASAIVAHNHPSGDAEPSDEDIAITNRIKAALELVDVRLLDHFIVTARKVTSLAGRGFL